MRQQIRDIRPLAVFIGAAREAGDFLAYQMFDRSAWPYLKEIIFIADCALVDTENLALLASGPDRPQILFISRLPESLGLAEEVKQEAFGQGNWTTISKFSFTQEFLQAVSRSSGVWLTKA